MVGVSRRRGSGARPRRQSALAGSLRGGAETDLTTRADPLGLAEGAELVAAIDLTAASKEVLRYALGIAERVPVRLTLLHVASPFEEDMAGSDRQDSAESILRAAVAPRLAARIEVAIGHGSPATAILDFTRSRNAAAVVLGLYPKGIVREHLSAQARTLRHENSCPVWFVPARRS